jgi:hypothetical protein
MTPFIFGKLATGNFFINRENERKRLKSNIRGRINTMLISPRRWGKSSLVKMVDNELSDENIRFCYIDLFNVRNEEEFYELFASEVIKASSGKMEGWIENSKKFIKGIIPRFSFGIDPQSDFKISFDYNQIKKSANEILEMPEAISKNKKYNMIVCIDEFQNISHFEKPMELQRKLRSVWQHHQETTYCLYGSKRHMMAEIFESPSMPFYKFGDTIFLKKIEEKYWIDFIVNQFKKTNKSIFKTQAKTIAQTVDNHPYHVQLLSNIVWQKTQTKCTKAILEEAIEELVFQGSMLYQKETDSLSNTQVNFLKAVVDGVEQFSSKDTLRNYNIGSQGNVKKIKEALENKEVIDLWGKKIEFLDPVFRLWFERIYMGKRS